MLPQLQMLEEGTVLVDPLLRATGTSTSVVKVRDATTTKRPKGLN